MYYNSYKNRNFCSFYRFVSTIYYIFPFFSYLSAQQIVVVFRLIFAYNPSLERGDPHDKEPTQQILDSIAAAPDGTVFTRSDFADLSTDADPVRRVLSPLVHAGTLYRVLRGVYAKLECSYYLQEYVAADPEAVAYAIARRHHWTIGPSRNAALNRQGLSTQVPVRWFFASDGPTRSYSWDNTTLHFEHENPKNITGMSPITILVFQALKALGQQRITEQTIQHLRNRFSPADKAILLQEGLSCTG